MMTSFKEYTVEIVDDAGYSLGSTDNSYTYNRVYSENSEYPKSKHGIRITKDSQTVASAIICESGGATGVHDNSFVITGDVLYICCSNAVYSFKLPALTLTWKKKLDAATCFAIYPFKDDFIIHGELEVKRIDKEGKIKWEFSANDIFVTQDGGEAVKFVGDKIELTDWNGDRYLLNEDGRLSK